MKFYLIDVKSVVNVNGKEVAFDYINTYYDADVAIENAKSLSKNKGMLDISVHEWIVYEDGSQDHTGNILYNFWNS